MNRDQIIKDSVKQGWVESMPESVRPFLRMSRYDRPIGFWLLAMPGWIGLAFAGISYGYGWGDLRYALLIAIGAIAMRGAGCTYNDIVDRDLDARVERTAQRPLPAGTMTLKAAWIWVVLQCAAGAVVLAFFPRLAQIIAVSSLALVAGYPYMKRITYWPQAWLGLTFNWAVLVAYAAKTGIVNPSLLFLYTGMVFWTVGYDTIYACQDKEDDALIGIKSTALFFGEKAKIWISVIYSVCILLIILAMISIPAPTIYLIGTIPFSLHLFNQVMRLDQKDGDLCLRLFKSNKIAAFLLIGSLLVMGALKAL